MKCIRTKSQNYVIWEIAMGPGLDLIYNYRTLLFVDINIMFTYITIYLRNKTYTLKST